MMRFSSLQDGLQVVMILGCGLALAGAGQAIHQSGTSATWGLERILGAGLSLLGLAIVALWLLTLAAALLASGLQRAGRPEAARVAALFTPAVMRRLAAALIGVNLLAVPAVAQASPSGVDVPPAPSATAPSTAGATRAAESADDALAASAVSPYWSVSAAPGASAPADTRAPGDAAGEDDDAQREEPSPTSQPSAEAGRAPGWTPTPMPVDGGLLVRQDTRATADHTDIVVAPGDSLWSIVSSHLGPLATASEVAEAWPAWFEANRAVIGDDPSLLIPGQVLQVPPG